MIWDIYQALLPCATGRDLAGSAKSLPDLNWLFESVGPANGVVLHLESGRTDRNGRLPRNRKVCRRTVCEGIGYCTVSFHMTLSWSIEVLYLSFLYRCDKEGCLSLSESLYGSKRLMTTKSRAKWPFAHLSACF